jgi:hypothetical protein
MASLFYVLAGKSCVRWEDTSPALYFLALDGPSFEQL